MPNRYVRDKLILIALDMVQLPNLEKHDAPDGTVTSDAYMIQWLQDIMDFWHHMVPFSCTVKAVSLNCTANQGYVNLPSDFILDVRDGYLVQTVANDTASMKRIHRVPLQKFINRRLFYQRATSVTYPNFYCVQDKDATTGVQRMQVSPTPTQAVTGQLYYYQLPAVLEANSKPDYPNDYVCIEYLRIRALEWSRIFEPGTAQKFTDRLVGAAKAAGLMNEPEDDEIPFDNQVYVKGGDMAYNSPYSWMGNV